DDVCGHAVVSEDLGDDAGVAMIERTHGVESVCCVMCAGLDGGLCDRELCVRVADADANFPARGFSDHFHCARDFGSDGDHANASAGGLPEAVKGGERGREQEFGRMHSAALVTEEWALEVNTNGESLNCVAVRRR